MSTHPDPYAETTTLPPDPRQVDTTLYVPPAEKPPFPWHWLAVGAGFLLGGLLLVCAGSWGLTWALWPRGGQGVQGQPRPAGEPGKPPVPQGQPARRMPSVDTNTLEFARAWGNEVAADQKYRGKLVLLDGEVRGVAREGKRSLLVVWNGAEADTEVDCVFQPGQAEQVGAAAVGGRVFVLGVCKGLVEGRPTLDDCDLASAFLGELRRVPGELKARYDALRPVVVLEGADDWQKLAGAKAGGVVELRGLFQAPTAHHGAQVYVTFIHGRSEEHHLADCSLVAEPAGVRQLWPVRLRGKLVQAGLANFPPRPWRIVMEECGLAYDAAWRP